MRLVSERPSRKQWALRLVVAFGIGVLAAFVQNRINSTPDHASAQGDRSSGRMSHAPAITTKAARPADAAVSRATARVASSPPAPPPEPPPMLAPVRWSGDLAQAYEAARKRGQLVLLYLAPSADT